ncbi:MAG: hypothetical protein ACJARU_000759 [Congregibacter sp.]|jgi:hypothetical protein
MRTNLKNLAFALTAVLAMCLSLPYTAFAESSSVAGVRVGTTTERTRLVLDMSAKVSYHFFRLDNPERIVLDLSDASVDILISPDSYTGTPILDLSYAPRAGEDLRVVVNLAEGDYQIRHFALTPNADAQRGHRLVVDIVLRSEGAVPKGPVEADSTAIGVTASATLAQNAIQEPQPADEAIAPSLSQAEVGSSTTSAESASAPPVVAVTESAPQSTAAVVSAPVVSTRPPPAATVSASRATLQRRKPKTGTLVDFSGTWQHEWAWGTESSESQKFESIIQPRWDVRFANGVDLTAILRVRADAVGDLGPTDRRPPNYSDISAPWFNSGEAEVSLRELFVDFQLGVSDWRLGKQQVVWGQADGIKVLDVVNPQSFREFILDDFDDSRIPLWTANVTVPIGEAASLQLLWIPDTTYHELAELDTPYGFSSPRIIPQVPITTLGEVDKPENPFSDSDAGFALSGFVDGWDLSLNYLYRYLDAPVLPVRVRGPLNLTLEPEYRRSHLLGGTFSNAFGDVSLRGEFAYNSESFQPTNTLANEAVAESEEFSALIGIDWALSMDALLSAQIYNSFLFDHVDIMARDESEQTLTLLYQQDFVNATWRFRGIGIHSLNDGDTQLQLKLSYWMTSDLQLWMGADTFSGNRQGLFGQFRERDRVLVGFEYGF